MARVFDSQLVALPTLDVRSAIAFTSALLAAASTEKKLPPRVERERHQVEERLVGLQVEARDGLLPVADSGRSRQADLREDAAFGATERWLLAWASLPLQAPQVEQAQRLHDLLFPDGLKFTRLPYREEWVEAQRRLDLIDEHKLSDDIDALGGALFLTAMREAHATYGEVLGITRPTAAEPSRAVGQARDLLLAALRSYVLQVAAHADPEQPSTVALSERLLAPIAAWQSRPRNVAGKPDGTDGGSGTDGTTPTTDPPPADPPPTPPAAAPAAPPKPE